MRNSLSRFRWVALAEGVSFLVLLGIAMPLKYAMDMPLAVKFVGWAHGVLFILYILTGAFAARDEKWPPLFVLGAFVASLVPFGTFVLDRRLSRENGESVVSGTGTE